MVSKRKTGQFRIGLQIKSAIVLSFIVLSAMVCGGWFYYETASQSLRGEDHRRAMRLGQALALATQDDVRNSRYEDLHRLVNGYLRNDNIHYIAILDGDGNMLASAARDARFSKFPNLIKLPVSVSMTRSRGNDILVLARPIVLRDVTLWKDRLAGSVRLVLDTRGTTAKLKKVGRRICLIGAAIVFFTIPVGYLLVWRIIVQPVRQLVEATRRLGKGDFQTRTSLKRNDEIGELAGAFNKMADDVASVQSELVQSNEQLEHKVEERTQEIQVANRRLQEEMEKVRTMASTDPLTGLSNRRRFAELLERYYDEANRYGHDLTCCMCDLDHYKDFNDAFGHQVGDEILVEAAKVIGDSLRSSDVAARYGGDEFVLLLPHTSVDRACSVAERVREKIVAISDKYGQIDSTLGVSIGVASLNIDHPDSGDKLLAMADRALYAAKEGGRGRVVVFSEQPTRAGSVKNEERQMINEKC